MKIFHLIDSGGLYGAEVMLLQLMTAQEKLGLQPLLCSIGTPGCEEKDIEREARARGLTLIPLRMRAGLNLAGAYRMIQTARDIQADLLHSHGYKGNILASCIPRTVRKIPLVSTLHGWTNTRTIAKMAVYEWLDRRMLRYKDAVIVVNKRMLDDPRLIAAKVGSDKLYVVNNGIEPQPLTIDDAEVSAATSQVRDFSRKGFVIGAIGRLSREKGFDTLLDAVALLHRHGHQVKLVIAGDGPLRGELQQQATALGVAGRVLFTGYLPDAGRYLSCFDVFVLSSLTEGLPITLLEAMRAGVPVVASAVGGIPDVIRDGVSGMLVAPGDVVVLTAAIERLMNDTSIATALAGHASTEFYKKYTSEKMARNYLEIYNNICRY